MIKAKKVLGQNFLESKEIVADIIRAADLQKGETVLEVGPGKGILTRAILETGAEVIAIEKDKRLIDYLETKFPSEIKAGKLKLIHGDILRFDFASYKLHVTYYKIVANIPYYITSYFLRKFLESPPVGEQPSKMVLMLQKEVAQRITYPARRGKKNKESVLSISVKVYGRPKIIKIVPAKYFSPQPKVDSAILLVDNISKNFFNEIGEKNFFKILKAGFSQKRKLLKNNLTSCQGLPLDCSPRVVLGNLKKCKIPSNARAENLSLKNWECLTKLHKA